MLEQSMAHTRSVVGIRSGWGAKGDALEVMVPNGKHENWDGLANCPGHDYSIPQHGCRLGLGCARLIGSWGGPYELEL